MHPAPSIILFTTLSGMGFGLIFWLGLAPRAGWIGAGFAVLALGLACAGLVASLAHLGQRWRFLKAFSQWRSSWLSREAVLAVATLGAFSALSLLRLATGRPLPWLGWPVAALALATVLATAMIYAQMRSVPRWRSPLTPLVFALAALAGGGLLAGAGWPAVAALVALGLVQVADWWRGDGRFRAAGTTLATATGLGGLGRLRLLEPPHTGQNYLLREMVHVIGRKHAVKLRLAGLSLAVVAPLLLLVAVPAGHLVAGLAVALHAAGLVILRWLFFAEAEHVVGLYYGKR